MIEIKDLCKAAFEQRYKLDISELKTVDDFRGFYDMLHRNKEILGLSLYSLEECLDNLNKLLDFIEKDNKNALYEIKGVTNQEIERVVRAHVKMRRTISKSIEDIRQRCEGTGCSEEDKLNSLGIYKSILKGKEVQKRSKRLILENQIDMGTLEKLEKLETKGLIQENENDIKIELDKALNQLNETERQLQEVRGSYRALINAVLPIITNPGIQQQLTKEEIVDITTNMLHKI